MLVRLLARADVAFQLLDTGFLQIPPLRDFARDTNCSKGLLVSIAIGAFGSKKDPGDAIDLDHFLNGASRAGAHDFPIALGDGVVAVFGQHFTQILS